MKETKETGRKLGQSLSSAFCEDFFERNYYEEDFYRLQGLTGFYNHRSSIISIFATRRKQSFFLSFPFFFGFDISRKIVNLRKDPKLRIAILENGLLS